MSERSDSRHRNIQKHSWPMALPKKTSFSVTRPNDFGDLRKMTTSLLVSQSASDVAKLSSIKPPPGAKAGGWRRLFAAKFPQSRVHRRHWEDISIDLDWYCRSKVSTTETEKQPSRRGQVFPIVHMYIWNNFFTIPRNKMQAEIGRMPHRKNAFGRASIDARFLRGRSPHRWKHPYRSLRDSG